MLCPSCDSEVEAGAWICPRCDFILDTSVLGGAAAPALPRARPVWAVAPSDQPEAMILGDVNVDPEDFQVLSGAAADGDGRTTTFLFYTSGATSRVLRPDVVPMRVDEAEATVVPTTPYEDFILAAIDGKRTVREIQRSSGLAPQEVTITLLTLLDKKIVRIAGAGPSTSSSEEIPIAKPRPGSKKNKRKKSAVQAVPEKTDKPEKRAKTAATDELPALTPRALDSEDAEEVTEWTALKGGPAAEASPEQIRDATARSATPLPVPKLSSAIFASAAASEQARERAEEETADSTAARGLHTPPPKIEVVTPPPLPRNRSSDRPPPDRVPDRASRPPEPKPEPKWNETRMPTERLPVFDRASRPEVPEIPVSKLEKHLSLIHI